MNQNGLLCVHKFLRGCTLGNNLDKQRKYRDEKKILYFAQKLFGRFNLRRTVIFYTKILNSRRIEINIIASYSLFFINVLFEATVH